LLPEAPETVSFTVVSSTHNPRNEENRAWIERHGQRRVALRISPTNMAEVMMHSDLAVMAGGTSTYEAACCGLPTLIVAIADNQISQSNAWAALESARYIGKFPNVDPMRLEREVRELCADSKKRIAMS